MLKTISYKSSVTLKDFTKQLFSRLSGFVIDACKSFFFDGKKNCDVDNRNSAWMKTEQKNDDENSGSVWFWINC